MVVALKLPHSNFKNNNVLMEMSLNIRPKNCYDHALQFCQSLQIRQQHPRGIIELNCRLSKSPMSGSQSSL